VRREVEIGLKAAVDLDGGRNGRRCALAFAPDAKLGILSPRKARGPQITR